MHYKKRVKQTIGVFLALALVIGLMPNMALAVEQTIATDKKAADEQVDTTGNVQTDPKVEDSPGSESADIDEVADKEDLSETTQPNAGADAIETEEPDNAEPDATVSTDEDTQEKGTATQSESAESEIAVQSEDEPAAQSEGLSPAAATGTVKAQAHVRDIGWQTPQTGSHITVGTTGKGLQMEALKLSLGTGYGTGSGISYKAHVQDIGWQNEVKNGALAGTTGRGLRIEALEISLTGSAASTYDIYYRVHVADYGWLGWASNGDRVGTTGLLKRVEALEIVVQAKGSAAPGSTSRPFITPLIKYTTQVQDYGWRPEVHDGALGGTSGKSKRLETLRVSLGDTGYAGGVTYEAYVENYGWKGAVSNGKNAGTVGKSLRIEGVRMKLTGDIANYYDVYYRVHVQDIGWMNWVSNWTDTGTKDMSMRTEAVEVKLVKKGAAAPKNDGYNKAYVTAFGNNGVSMQGAGQDYSWQSARGNNGTIGTTGKGKRLEAMKVQLPGCGSGATQVSGGIQYNAHVSNVGWQGWKSNGGVAGTTGQSKAIECVKIKLTGQVADFYDVYYRAHVSNVGWLGWAKNGSEAGSTGRGNPIESIQICVVPKGAAAPGAVGNSKIDYYAVSGNTALNKAVTNIIDKHTGKNLRACFNYVRDMQYRTKATWPSYAGWWEDYALDMANTHSGNCYSYATLFYYLAKACGYSGAVISGQVPTARGNLGPHSWTEIYIDDATYVCDPEGAHEAGFDGYLFTYGNAPLRYVK